jgi:hypothetical protein
MRQPWAAWGADIDREVLEDSVYQLNRFFERNRIPKFVRCGGEFLSLESPKKQRANSNSKRLWRVLFSDGLYFPQIFIQRESGGHSIFGRYHCTWCRPKTL